MMESERLSEKEYYEMQAMIYCTDIDIKTHGHYRTPSGMPRGLVVHYTAGRNDPIATLSSLSKRGLGCLVMDQRGKIYRAKNQELNEVAYHAGSSEWKDLTAISYHCLGMEICNAGKLDDKGKAWFGQQYEQSEIRKVAAKDNQKSGLYHKYTQDQEDSLIEFCLWLAKVNPEFDLDYVVGHDEIAPKRKSDPGGSLSMTMPEFRKLLKSRIEDAQSNS